MHLLHLDRLIAASSQPYSRPNPRCEIDNPRRTFGNFVSSLIPRLQSLPLFTQIGAVQQTADLEVYRLGVVELAQPFVLLLHRVQRSATYFPLESRPERNVHLLLLAQRP